MSQLSEENRPKSPVKYSDVFEISGELADKPVTPEDAAMMQAAETTMFGHTQKGGPAAAMQSAATVNQRAGLLDVDNPTGGGEQRVAVMVTDFPGTRVITEMVGEQVVGQYSEPVPVAGLGAAGKVQVGITIGEALEATARIVGDKAVEQSDAAAIQAAEVRATGSTVLSPGGLAAQAQSAATLNERTRDEDKVKLSEVLTDAAMKLPADKEVTREDAVRVLSAETRNNPDMTANPGGVAAAISAAATLNETGSC